MQAWDYLATDVKNKQGEQAVLWRHAMLKTMYCVENGLTPGDIKKSFSSGNIFQQVLLFERTHEDLRKIGATMSELTAHKHGQLLQHPHHRHRLLRRHCHHRQRAGL